MNKITSIEDINALITAGVEECTTLEYNNGDYSTEQPPLLVVLFILSQVWYFNEV